MAQLMVIAFHDDGSIEYTRTKDLTLFGGSGTMQRVTDIQKAPAAPIYYIRWMLGPYADSLHTHDMAIEYLGLDELATLQAPRISHSEAMEFPSYEAAVQHEITMLNAMRKAGVRFSEQTA